jgi:hypothetical protein
MVPFGLHTDLDILEAFAHFAATLYAAHDGTALLQAWV